MDGDTCTCFSMAVLFVFKEIQALKVRGQKTAADLSLVSMQEAMSLLWGKQLTQLNGCRLISNVRIKY